MKTKSALLAIMFFVCTSLYVTAYAQAVNVQDSLALVALYNSTNGPNWKIHKNWLKGPVVSWYGITINDARVTTINLGGNDLAGNIPSEIGNLTNLNDLYLVGNYISTLPPGIGSLTNLSSINLGNNRLNSLPNEIGNLTNLITLNLYGNNLRVVPPEIGNLKNLTSLSLGDKLTILPPEIGNLSKLTYLSLEANQLSILPPEMGNLVNLTTLELSGNNFDSFPAAIGNLVNLTSLVLSNNQLTNLPPEIDNLSNLRSLYLSGNLLTSVPDEIGKLTNLSILYLDGNLLTSLPPEFGQLVNMNNLALADNQFSILPPELGNLTNLYTLYLADNHLTSLPPEMGNLINLTSLSLSYNQLITLPSDIGNLSHLSDLSLDANQLSILPPEIGNLSNLLLLDLDGNQLIILPREIGNLENLSRLELSYNQLTSLPSEIGKLVNLTYLNLSNNQLSSLPPEIGNLISLSLNLSNNRLTFDGIEMVVQKLYYVNYYYQANIPLHQNSNSLFVSAGGTLSNNTYNWYKVEDGSSTTIVGDSVFHPSSSGKYYAAVTNRICYQLTLYTDTVEYDATLPVTVINLKAQQQGSIIKVDWSSLTEINMASYEVQRSVNANAFSSIGSINAKGNSAAQQNYSFNDLQPLNGNNYYRLKAIDKDGSITYSNVVLVNISSDKTFTIVYPVPAKDILHIQTNGIASFSLINQAGKILLTTNISGNGSMNIGGFAVGLYYLKNNSTGVVQKVVVEK